MYRARDAGPLSSILKIAVGLGVSGLIFGARTPIWWSGYKFREAPFKDYWSDDTKNNSRE
jgi:hypothetical protein